MVIFKVVFYHYKSNFTKSAEGGVAVIMYASDKSATFVLTFVESQVQISRQGLKHFVWKKHLTRSLLALVIRI